MIHNKPLQEEGTKCASIRDGWADWSGILFAFLLVLLTAAPQAAYAWDAGTDSRKHNPGSGGENPITILDTRPHWLDTETLTNSGRVSDCPAGYENRGPFGCWRDARTYGLKYKKGCTTVFKKFPCDPGYTDNGCTCGRGASTKGFDSMTCRPDEARILVSGTEIPRCYTKPVCPDGYEYWGFLCYVTAPGVQRTAVSTVVHHVRQGGNTHLWIVNQALDLLQKSGQPGAAEFVAMMNRPNIRLRWEDGLWDGDGTAYVDYPDHQGTHFYNGAGKDRTGATTDEVTYNTVKFNNTSTCNNARECAAYEISLVGRKQGELETGDAYHLGLALHYMTDVTQPMHASGWHTMKIPFHQHPQYEFYAAFVQGRFPATNMNWDKRWIMKDDDQVLHEAAVKSNGFAPSLSQALHITGDAGICSIEGFNGIDGYLGFCFYNDPEVDKLTGQILNDAYQSTASYLYAVARTLGTPMGDVWVLGTTKGTGGYNIARWNPSRNTWVAMPGEATQIAVGPEGPWVVKVNGDIYRWVNNNWKQVLGKANGIGVGSSGDVWVVGTNPQGSSDFSPQRWNPATNNWQQIYGGITQIAVGPQGPWAINSQKDIVRWVNNTWQQVPGTANGISVGPTGDMWILGTAQVPGGYNIARWDSDTNTWEPMPGGAIHIAGGPQGLWAINSQKDIYRWVINNATWELVPGGGKANGISVGPW